MGEPRETISIQTVPLNEEDEFLSGFNLYGDDEPNNNNTPQSDLTGDRGTEDYGWGEEILF